MMVRHARTEATIKLSSSFTCSGSHVKILYFLIAVLVLVLVLAVGKMYKALEAGYQMGLESLNENLSEVRAELVFAQRQLQFKPPLEELRASYYRETKKFVSIPNAFEGFGNSKVRG